MIDDLTALTTATRFYTPERAAMTREQLCALVFADPFVLSFQSYTTGMVYSVDRALAIVRAQPRDWIKLPTTYALPDELDAVRVAMADPLRPGLVYGYRDAAGKPRFDLADGNHRFARAKQLGLPFFPVYPLTADEIAVCALFYALPDGVAPVEIVYRNLEDA